MYFRTFAVLFGMAAILAIALPPVHAAELPAPTGEVVLTVTGKIGMTNKGAAADLDIAMLEALPGRVTQTETPWTKGSVRFEGPLGQALLEKLGAGGTKLRITALNDYVVEVPVEDFAKWPVILATRKDGSLLTVRDKGPIFLIYPFDLDRSLYNEKIFARSVWQIRKIDVQ